MVRGSAREGRKNEEAERFQVFRIEKKNGNGSDKSGASGFIELTW